MTCTSQTAPWTTTSSACAGRSSPTRPIPGSSSACGAWGIDSMADTGQRTDTRSIAAGLAAATLRSEVLMTCVWMLVAMVAVAVSPLHGQQATVRGDDRVRLETAINKEVIDGDLAGAMAMYRALSESTERDVKAQAILRLGQAYK